MRTSDRSQKLPVFVRGMEAALKGTVPGSEPTGSSTIGELEVFAVAASVKGDHEKAIKLMRDAVAQEEKLGAPSGPPGLIKPAHELFGELLVRAGKPAEAIQQFKISLLRQPNRARSLIGLARAAVQAGDRTTAQMNYEQLLAQWQQADAELPELKEAREYLKR